jgi:hypothetical protein
MRKIDNLVHYDGQWMTGADRLARRVYKSGNRRNVVARRKNGRLTGFYVINDEGETSLIEIRQFSSLLRCFLYVSYLHIPS